MKPGIISLLLAPSLHAGLVPLGEHLDVRFRWVDNVWTCKAVTDSAGEVEHDPHGVFLPLADRAYAAGTPANSGARFTQPASSAFDFTGVPDGEPFWIAVQGTPGIGEAWPGFENNQNAGTFGSYIPEDIRVSQSTARPWIRVSLVEYVPPHGKESHFSMWSSTGPKVWMSTFDPAVEDSYYLTEGSHTHVNWGFSKQGIHKLRLRASAFAGPGGTNPTGWSDTFTLTFAVGTFARWQAENFSAARLDDPAICGPAADPDSDGIPNLLEYAFGTLPLAGGPHPAAGGLGMPAFSLTEENGTVYQTLVYPRRRAAGRVNPETYRPVFATDPAGPWTSAGVEETSTDFPAESSALNTAWELVTARRPVPGGNAAGFARVVVTGGD